MIAALVSIASSPLVATIAPPTQADVDALIAQLASSDPAAVDDAACGLGRLGRIGSRAVPALTRLLEEEILSGTRIRWVRRSPGALPQCESVADEMYERRPPFMKDESAVAWSRGPVMWAIRQLNGSETTARSLLDLFRRNPELRCDYRRVPQLLGDLGPKALPALEEGLRDGLEAVRVARQFEREDEEREQRQAAAARRDWLSEFPSYPGASKVCSGHVLGSSEGRRHEIAFSLYSTKDDPTAVVGFYAAVRQIKSERGATTLTARSADGKRGCPSIPSRVPTATAVRSLRRARRPSSSSRR